MICEVSFHLIKCEWATWPDSQAAYYFSSACDWLVTWNQFSSRDWYWPMWASTSSFSTLPHQQLTLTRSLLSFASAFGGTARAASDVVRRFAASARTCLSPVFLLPRNSSILTDPYWFSWSVVGTWEFLRPYSTQSNIAFPSAAQECTDYLVSWLRPVDVMPGWSFYLWLRIKD